jgi:hypothetical protein
VSTLPTMVGRLPVSWRSGSSGVIHGHLPPALSGATTLCSRPQVDPHARAMIRPEVACPRCLAVVALARARLERRAGQVGAAEPGSDGPRGAAGASAEAASDALRASAPLVGGRS